MPGLLSAGELGRERLEALLAAAAGYRAGMGRRHPDAVVALAFYADSLRTRVGFDVAAARLGARTTTVHAERQGPAMWAPERLEDAVRSIGPWCDALCLRHPEASASRRAAAVSAAPVINCGNGDDEHPTQAVVDLFALQTLTGRLDGLRVAVVGDLHAMRSAHSLVLALAAFEDVFVRAIAPAGLELPAAYAGEVRLEATTELRVDDVDVIYVAGLPAETRTGVLSREQQARYRITPEVAHATVLCPLPRVDEIDPAVDALPQAAYFEQSALGLYARMAVLDAVLSG
ncbi:aspartate carbamoyltransferase [Solirubrobacter sp. CPCC 204708]|uniref:Aspartate carbamoyltransferase n=1 Tax=Solirubrobacter deserti TaxID=2282478 RepID=A0ABT4RNH5_9ACTN|nr:hypothetical protein [Solirubrobacter deserti]MBE2318353.1 aspartate carbamoyltransferase [Solirubrobacter deserti]MDA0140127.1 hypothetical protein [Solirubrobacter deserti]